MTTITLKDINESAYLLLSGFDYMGAEERAGNDGRVLTHFTLRADKPADAVEELRNAYLNGSARVDPKMYAIKQDDLRKIIIERRRLAQPRRPLGG